MGKDMIIKILESQLEVANATNSQLSTANSQLNETVRSLQVTVKDLNGTIADLRKTVANLEDMLMQRDRSLGKAQSQLKGLKAMTFRKSEKQQTAADAAVAGPEDNAREEAAEEERKAAERRARGNNGAKRKIHFELETREEDVYPEDLDRNLCVEVGVKDATRYSMLPPRFIKTVYHIHTLRRRDDDSVIMSGKAPVTPLQNSRFDGSFVAGIAELRYLYSMPVERIVKYFQSHGFDLDKKTAHGLLAKTAGLFEDLHKAMGLAVKEDGYLNCDESYHTVLVKSGGKDGKGSRKGYVWILISAHTGLVYCFYEDGSRGKDVILNELKGYQGIIQSDGLGAYKALAAQSGGDITRAACLQHCKRPFLADDLKGNEDARKVVELSNQLYRNEHKHRIGIDGWTVEDNLRWRQEYAPPILAELKSLLQRIKSGIDKYPPTSDMGKAANYFLNEWDGIEAIPSYGDVTWDNNLIERCCRYISLSRHNSLFFGSHAGARRGCIFFSLACSCRNRGINFFEYLTDILNRSVKLQNGAPPEAYRDLLPDRWTKG